MSRPLLFHLMSTTDEKKKKRTKRDGERVLPIVQHLIVSDKGVRLPMRTSLSSSLVYGANAVETTAVVV